MHKRVSDLTLNAVLVCVLLTPTVALSADEAEYALLLLLPHPIAREAVVPIAMAAFSGRKWTIQSSSQDSVTGHIDHRSVSATLKLRILGDRIEYLCHPCTISSFGDESVGSYEDGSGSMAGNIKRVSPFTPKRWINNIRSDISRGLMMYEATRAPDGRHPDRNQDTSTAAERFRNLDSLLSEGLISQEEYDNKRAEILSDL